MPRPSLWYPGMAPLELETGDPLQREAQSKARAFMDRLGPAAPAFERPAATSLFKPTLLGALVEAVKGASTGLRETAEVKQARAKENREAALEERRVKAAEEQVRIAGEASKAGIAAQQAALRRANLEFTYKTLRELPEDVGPEQRALLGGFLRDTLNGTAEGRYKDEDVAERLALLSQKGGIDPQAAPELYAIYRYGILERTEKGMSPEQARSEALREAYESGAKGARTKQQYEVALLGKAQKETTLIEKQAGLTDAQKDLYLKQGSLLGMDDVQETYKSLVGYATTLLANASRIDPQIGSLASLLQGGDLEGARSALATTKSANPEAEKILKRAERLLAAADAHNDALNKMRKTAGLPEVEADVAAPVEDDGHKTPPKIRLVPDLGSTETEEEYKPPSVLPDLGGILPEEKEVPARLKAATSANLFGEFHSVLKDLLGADDASKVERAGTVISDAMRPGKKGGPSPALKFLAGRIDRFEEPSSPGTEYIHIDGRPWSKLDKATRADVLFRVGQLDPDQLEQYLMRSYLDNDTLWNAWRRYRQSVTTPDGAR